MQEKLIRRHVHNIIRSMEREATAEPRHADQQALRAYRDQTAAMEGEAKHAIGELIISSLDALHRIADAVEHLSDVKAGQLFGTRQSNRDTADK